MKNILKSNLFRCFLFIFMITGVCLFMGSCSNILNDTGDPLKDQGEQVITLLSSETKDTGATGSGYYNYDPRTRSGSVGSCCSGSGYIEFYIARKTYVYIKSVGTGGGYIDSLSTDQRIAATNSSSYVRYKIPKTGCYQLTGSGCCGGMAFYFR